jgi:hypothetical protein
MCMCVCVCVSDVCGTRVAVMGKGEREGSNEGVKQQEQGGEWLVVLCSSTDCYCGGVAHRLRALLVVFGLSV